MDNLVSETYDEISLKQLVVKIRLWWIFLKAQWFIIVITSFIGGLIGFLYASQEPVIYKAKTTFILEEGKSASSGLGGLASLAGQFGVDVGGGSGGGLFSGDNILLYLKSPTLAREVLLSNYDTTSNQSLADVYASVYRLNEKWKKNSKIGDITFPIMTYGRTYSRLQDSLLQSIIEGIIKKQFIVARTDKKAGFIDVTAKMVDESLAKRYCEKIVKTAVENYVKIKTQRQTLTVNKLQARVDSIAFLLNKKTISSASLQTQNSTMDLNPLFKTTNSVAVETNLRDKALLATIFASVSQNLELAKFSLSQETPVIQIIDLPMYPLYKDQVSRKKMAIIFSITFMFFTVIVLILKKILRDLD